MSKTIGIYGPKVGSINQLGFAFYMFDMECIIYACLCIDFLIMIAPIIYLPTIYHYYMYCGVLYEISHFILIGREKYGILVSVNIIRLVFLFFNKQTKCMKINV